jgi:hypothetical protein
LDFVTCFASLSGFAAVQTLPPRHHATATSDIRLDKRAVAQYLTFLLIA